MDTNDTRQTYKQFRERKQRIDISQAFDNKIEKNSNEIQDIDEEIERLNTLRNEKLKIKQQLHTEKHQEMLKQYNQDELIKEIIKLGEKTTCSRDFLSDIKNACSTGVNITTVNLNTIEKLVSIDEDIYNQIPHTNIIGDMLNNFGKKIDFPGEKEEEDDANGT